MGCYERQKAHQIWRYANDKEFREKSRLYHKIYNQAIRDDPMRHERERQRRRQYYLEHREERLAYQRQYNERMKLKTQQS